MELRHAADAPAASRESLWNVQEGCGVDAMEDVPGFTLEADHGVGSGSLVGRELARSASWHIGGADEFARGRSDGAGRRAVEALHECSQVGRPCARERPLY